MARRVRITCAAIVGLLVVLLPSALATADTSTKWFTLSASEPTVAAGDSLQGSTYALILGNSNTSQQALGSANLFLVNPNGPVDFLVQSACIVSGNTCTPVTVSGGTVQLRNLSLVPGASVTIDVSGYAPCDPPQEVDTWNAIVKQANNFSGQPGNGFALLTNTSLPTIGLTANTSCSLSFAAGEPNDAQVNNAITTTQLNSPPGSPVQVQVLGSGGGVAVASSDQVTLTVNNPNSSNPGPVLSSTPAFPINASSGLVLFPDLTINQSGAGYQLTATSPHITSGTSTLFNIWDAVTDCGTKNPNNPVACDVHSQNGSQNSDVNGSTTNGSAGVAASLESYLHTPCNDANFHAPFETTFFSVNLTGTTKTVTVTIFNPVAAASQYAVCFVDANGTASLLATCSKFVPIPCVMSIKKDRAGNVVEIISLPVGGPDPHVY